MESDPAGVAFSGWFRHTLVVPPRSAESDVLDHNGMVDRVARRQFAETVAHKHGVDAGDVEHVLSNLTLPPIERLRRSMQRARLGRPSRK